MRRVTRKEYEADKERYKSIRELNLKLYNATRTTRLSQLCVCSLCYSYKSFKGILSHETNESHVLRKMSVRQFRKYLDWLGVTLD